MAETTNTKAILSVCATTSERVKDLVIKNRSYRRYYEDFIISQDTLCDLIELARHTASTVNSQALRFKLITDNDDRDAVFENLYWAGLLRDWDGPEKGERPSAYIIILCDLSVGSTKHFDDGIAAQTILLGATEKGLGGCMFGSINRSNLAEKLSIDLDKYSIDLVVALGKPKECVKIVPVSEDGSTAYFRDENGVHYVPKRSLDDLII